jgi:hypothetical protein
MSKHTRTFKNILPVTTEKKGDGYFRYGWNDNLPLELIEAINNSGVAKKAAKKYAEYIQADGFVSPVASEFKVNSKQTADEILEVLAISFSYFWSAVIHVSRLGNGRVGRIEVMPTQKFRRGVNGTWFYNPTIGEDKYEKKAWIELQDFQGEVASFEAMDNNVTHFGGRGEILYIYNGNPFDSGHYAIPDYLAAFEDLKTSSELSKMDYEAVLNGFVLGGIMTFSGVNETTEGEDGLTDRQRVEEAMTQFTGLQKNKDGLTSRFGVLAHFVETPEQAPTYTATDPKPILEASNTKRDIIERSICRLWGVHPVLLGYAEAAVLGNKDAIEQARGELRNAVNPVQRMITTAFTSLYGKTIDWTISEFGVEVNIPSEGDRILSTLNSLSPLLATKIIDLIPQDKLLSAFGISTQPIKPVTDVPE